MFTNYSPYYGNFVPQQIPRMEQPFQQPNMQNMQNMYKPNLGLQGKSVDSLEVVKAIDIPLDGTISYFPLADGTAIVTKQLQQDGTSKTIIYKPVEDDKKPQPKYVTIDEVNNAIRNANRDDKDIKELRDEIKNIKRMVRDMSYDKEG